MTNSVNQTTLDEIDSDETILMNFSGESMADSRFHVFIAALYTTFLIQNKRLLNPHETIDDEALDFLHVACKLLKYWSHPLLHADDSRLYKVVNDHITAFISALKSDDLMCSSDTDKRLLLLVTDTASIALRQKMLSNL